jgi:hypothetical protein
MIWRLEIQKIFLESRDENIEMEAISSGVGSFIGNPVCLQRA